MASSEVDQKFLGKLAKAVQNDNPLLATMLFKILGLSINLSEQLTKARKQRRQYSVKPPYSFELYLHIIWLSREGLVMLEQYVLPVVGRYVELKVLAYKLRASFYHIFVLFYNQPPVSSMGLITHDFPESSSTEWTPPRTDKGKGVAHDDDLESTRSSLQPTHPLEGGPVHPPPGFGHEAAAAFLLPSADYLPVANRYFIDAITLAESLLWGSHSLRLSVKTEYAAFLYECVHDTDGSRKLAKDTITEVYEAAEGIDNDMFSDACELVTVLGKMMKRGLGTSSRAKGNVRQSQVPAAKIQTQLQQQQQWPRQSQRQQGDRPPGIKVNIPPPLPPTTSAPLQPIHPDDMVDFI